MIVAMYDITGIQEYVFSSTKLRENLGASIIVQRIFTDFFSEHTEARVVYIGGGNAMVEYDDRDRYREATCGLSREFVRRTGGALRFAAHAEERRGSFQDVRKRLVDGLNARKNRLSGSVPLMGIAITRECPYDGWPAVTMEGGAGLSYPAWCKRQEDPDVYFRETRRLLDDDLAASGCEFPSELDKLGQVREEQNYIAVVHIDGNNMGRAINEALSGISQYEEAARAMKRLSSDIDAAYTGAFTSLVRELERGQSGRTLPIRPIILSGDDVTFVSRGDLGLKLAADFLCDVSDRTVEAAGKALRLSACAGVAIVKSHFPFSRAYGLAEELCQSAKRKAKVHAERSGAPDVGSWLDFHIVQGGILSDIGRIRSQHYQVRGMPGARDMSTADGTLKYRQYHLLGRPWRVCGPGPAEYDWNELLRSADIFRDSWPANRIKQLRNSLIGIPSERDLLMEEIRSRGYALPDFPGKEHDNLFFENHPELAGTTPYFDAIEILDFHPGTSMKGGLHAD
ncbi:MAG TPA: hypothetical protein PLR71_00305 [Deltaproteobacteria bacterium]|nr:hypothetical protein [Deltaproteobacteria bacterium]HQI79971.1 hypothetical protein [Deltaproteobacteria bacterium]